MNSLAELRTKLEDVERELEALALEQVEVERQLRRQPAAQVLETGLRTARRTLRITSLVVLCLGAATTVGYWAKYRPRTPFTEADIALMDERSKKLVELAAADKPPADLTARVDDEIRVKMDAEYPAALGEANGRVAYPGLRRRGVEVTTETDAMLRWTNIGVAACTVGQSPLARWSQRVLFWMADPKDADGIPIPANRDAPFDYPQARAKRDERPQRLATEVLVQCLAEGHNLLAR